MEFFKEMSEALGSLCCVVFSSFDLFLELVINVLKTTEDLIGRFADAIFSCFSYVYSIIAYVCHNFNEFFNLTGRSILLLVQLIPRTFVLAYHGTCKLLQSTKESILDLVTKFYLIVSSASPELLLGALVSIVICISITKLTIRTIRERNITWRSVFGALLWFICSTYILIFRSIAR